MEDLINLQQRAIENHLTILNQFKIFFKSLLNTDNRDTEYFNQEKFFESVNKSIQETSTLYQGIIEKYPEDKVK